MANDKQNTSPNVPNLRFPEFSGEWETLFVDDVCPEFQSGKNIKAENIKSEGLYPVYGGNGLRGYTDIYNHDGTYVLIGRQGALCGNVRLVEGRNYITEHAIAVSSSNEHCIYFLYYLFYKMNLGQYSDQSAQPGLAVNKLLRLKLHIPLKDEQTKIAKILTLLDTRIATQNKIIEDLKKLKVAIRDKQLNAIRKHYGLNYQICDLLDYEQPTKYVVTDTEYSDDISKTPVLTANKAFILGYTNETFGVYDKGKCIILDDFTLDCKYVDFPFKVKSSAIKILTVKNGYSLRYVYEYLNYLNLETTEHKRHYISEMGPMMIAYPTDKKKIDDFNNMMTSLESKIEIENKYLQSLLAQKFYLLSNMFI